MTDDVEIHGTRAMRERRAPRAHLFHLFIINYNSTRDSWTTTASGLRGDRGEKTNETV